MKKKLSYRDKLVELAYIYDVKEIKDYEKRRKNLTTGQLELILKKNKIIKNFYKIRVKKNIPVYAGLGGGTSNSFSIVSHFINNKFSEKNFAKLLDRQIAAKVCTELTGIQNARQRIHLTRNQ